jgi:4-hydroxyphenylpyruvate dioxygenase
MAVKRGATSISEPQELKDDDGAVIVATIATYGDCTHTFVQRLDYKGAFMPGYRAVTEPDPLASFTASPNINFIDHVVRIVPTLLSLSLSPRLHTIYTRTPLISLVTDIYICMCTQVGNQDDDQMTPVVEWYEKVLQFHRFWSVDDKMVHTEYRLAAPHNTYAFISCTERCCLSLSSLRSIVMVDYDRKVKMPINEPADGKRKSQIKE